METKPRDIEGPATTSAKTIEHDAKTENTSTHAKTAAPVTEDVPDPEEDDLDDLDGMGCPR